MAAIDDWLRAAARQRAEQGSVRHAEPRAGLDLASNDYLGLAGDKRLAEAAGAALERYGTSARASRVVTGTTEAHLELEHELAYLTGQPSCLVFSSGYTANLAVLTALGDLDTLLITDAHMHASMIDAARLSRSPVAICPHSDLNQLETLLHRRSHRRAIVVVESIYSVLGDTADLAQVAGLCERYDALLVVDEAHGIGVAGAGHGTVHAAGLAGAPHVAITATMSKALGSQGGAVLGSEVLREHLINTARSFIFDTALAPAAAAAAAEACRVIGTEPGRVSALHTVAERIATAAGIQRAPGAVQSITVGKPDLAFDVTQRLGEQGILVGCFRPPSVPDGISRLRLTARASIDPEMAATAAALAAKMIATV